MSGDRTKFGPFEHVTFYGLDENEDWTPYMQKWGVDLGPLGSVWVHRFLRGDADRDLHDHPWPFWTFPLTPYVEVMGVPDGRGGYVAIRKVVTAFRVHHRPADYAHRVMGRWHGQYSDDLVRFPYGYIPEAGFGDIWTVVFHRPKSRSWGFWKYREGKWCWNSHKKYTEEGGKFAPCDDE